MSFIKIFLLQILSLIVANSLVYAYKPVVLVHGILSDAASMMIVGEQIKLVRFAMLLLANKL